MDQQNLLQRTSAHIAVSQGHEAIVKMLIEFGSDPSLVDGCGRSTLEAYLRQDRDLV